MKRYLIKPSHLFTLSFSIVFFILICSAGTKEMDTEIELKYCISYEGDNWEKNRLGLLWSLSYLGARLPSNSLDSGITVTGEQRFRLSFSQLGFSAHALKALNIICDSLKATPYYQKHHAIDLGHFIAITLGSSWHYYAITGAPKTMSELLKQKRNTVVPMLLFLKTSNISHHQRRILVYAEENITGSLFIAEEGHGDLYNGNFVATEYEVLDIMENGQLRAMIYDSLGHLKVAADEVLSGAGKPAKCIWCHELTVPGLLTPADSFPGEAGPAAFMQLIKQQNVLLRHHRDQHPGDLDYNKPEGHTSQEIIYTSFMEPSLRRLSQEWDLPLDALEKIMQTQARHLHHEFTFLGDLLGRNAIQHLAPWNQGPLPGNIREPGFQEPDFLHFSGK